MRQPIRGGGLPQVGCVLQRCACGVDPVLAQAFTPELKFDPHYLPRIVVVVGPDVLPPVGALGLDVQGLVIDARADALCLTPAELEARQRL